MLLQQIVNGLLLGGVYVLVAVAFSICWGFLNFVNFSIPALFSLGGFCIWVFMQYGIGWWPSALLAVVLAAAVSCIVERFTFRFQRNAGPVVPLVSSLGFLILIENVLLALYGSEGRAVQLPLQDVNWRIDGLVISLPQLGGLLLAILLVAGFSVALKTSKLGRGVRAIAESPDTAVLLGVRINSLVPLVFLLAGVFSGLAGVLFALGYQQVSPFIGDQVALKGLSAMVLGGMGSIWGAVLGGLVIGIVEVLAIRFWSADFVKIAVYGVLLLLLIIKPSGLLGNGQTRQEKF
ncbi:branched-chain amino acid ABC transporter permease [Pigmentiphaga sp. NML080357]|uniref:branched-chain amino acid ABC transporter permease n=1 Tax=Pigmentiphaga sp. NML080357 TaxID=2008675 RepID=UPI000B416BF7|nr:branched-chain amino acid ABC transporter permease [Pigmentiphaga sp. NML080357]OVZ54330.1 branched-chain amino acid ABC transporter permease [Pigmentiphaga sp. NML080357]